MLLLTKCLSVADRKCYEKKYDCMKSNKSGLILWLQSQNSYIGNWISCIWFGNSFNCATQNCLHIHAIREVLFMLLIFSLTIKKWNADRITQWNNELTHQFCLNACVCFFQFINEFVTYLLWTRKADKEEGWWLSSG